MVACHLSLATRHCHSSRLFVYGTLRRGFRRHGLLRSLEAQYVGKGSVRAELFNLGHFPGAQKCKAASSHVVGEVYRLRKPAQAFKTLDRIEDFRPTAPSPGLFRRETAAVTLQDGERVSAWVYWLNRVPGPKRRIHSGDYAKKG